METHLKIIGLTLIVLSIAHVTFPKYFDWKNDFKSVSLINKEMMYVHTFFVALVVFLIGILCLLYPNELTQTNLGKILALGFFIFWFLRLLVQFFGYSSKLWRGKKFETIIHILFSIMWTYFSVIFFLVYWQ